MGDLESKLAQARQDGARFILVITDGVFSMEGELAPLADIVDICERYEAVLIVDDSHATGILGPRGRGTAEELGLWGKVPIHTGTLGKAMGSAMGGYVTGPEAGGRDAAPALAAVPVLQLPAAGRGRRRHRGVQDGHGGPPPAPTRCRRTPATSASA